MTEGGLFHWKIQKIKSFGPTADYSEISKPLPDPPKGMEWVKNEKTGDWIVCKKQTNKNIQTETKVDKSEEEENEWEILDSHILCHSDPKGNISSKTVVSLDSNLRDDIKSQDLRKGVDYIEHIVLPSDTLQGICLSYKISPTKVRQVNKFSGSTLLLAPQKLIIPISSKEFLLDTKKIRLQDRNSKDFKIHAMINEFPSMNISEASAYLDMSDGKLDNALSSAREDHEWELRQLDTNHKSIHDHKVHIDVHEGVPVSTNVSTAVLRAPSEVEMSNI